MAKNIKQIRTHDNQSINARICVDCKIKRFASCIENQTKMTKMNKNKK